MKQLEKNKFIRHEMIGTINITPMFPGRENEVIADVKDMYSKDIIAKVAFIAYLLPDGYPEPADLATPQAKVFTQYKSRLAGSKIPVGMLLQNTMGHITQKRKHPFQKIQRANGTLVETCCPADPGFLDYMRKSIRTIAGARPDFIILDDDTRLKAHGFCFCDRHIEIFNKKTGSTITDPVKISEKLKNDPKFYAEWAKCQAETLGVFAKVIREALDSVDPAIEVIACGGGNVNEELLEKISHLTGKGQIPTIRFGNAVYLNDSGRGFPGWLLKNQYQIEVSFPKNIRIIAETDTYTHLLYATSAQALHRQYAFSLLSGCCGGKLWITDLSDYNPQNGLIYRKKLAKYAKFYRKIGEMIPEWEGIVVPFPAKHQELEWPRWGDPVLATWGVPFSYERCYKTDRLVALSDAFFKSYTHKELQTILSGRVLLDGSAAIALTERGYGDLIGFDARKWDLPRISFEEGIRNEPIIRVPASVIIENLRPGAEVRTKLHVKEENSIKTGTILPGAVKFKNALGGEIYTVAGIASQTSRENEAGAFSFMNLIRREFLAKELNFGIYHSGEEPIYVGLFNDRGSNCAVLVNFGLDTVEKVPFANFPADIKKVENLEPDGTWKEISFKDGIIDLKLQCMDIAVLRFIKK